MAETQGAEAFCSLCGTSFPPGTTACPNDGSQLVKLDEQPDRLLGKVLDGRYEILGPLGSGGMGTVYRGLQLSVDRPVAIKVIHSTLTSDRDAVKRFLREARLASKLNQANIVNVYDFGQSEGVLYLVMELLVGRTLASELGQPLSVRRAVAIVLQLCDALEAAHAQAIVHRDLKPGNIVILGEPGGRDVIKVLDFGLAKLAEHAAQSQVTNPETMLGTPLYMAPEQIQGKDSDTRTDLYALGCILYELLSGQPPFVEPNLVNVLARHLGDEPAPLPDLPTWMQVVISRLLVKDPAGRFQTASEVRAALESNPQSQPMATANISSSQALAATGALPQSVMLPVVTPGRRRIVLALISAALIGGLVFVVFTVVRSRPGAVTLDARTIDAAAVIERPDAHRSPDVPVGTLDSPDVPDGMLDTKADAVDAKAIAVDAKAIAVDAKVAPDARVRPPADAFSVRPVDAPPVATPDAAPVEAGMDFIPSSR